MFQLAPISLNYFLGTRIQISKKESGQCQACNFDAGKIFKFRAKPSLSFSPPFYSLSSCRVVSYRVLRLVRLRGALWTDFPPEKERKKKEEKGGNLHNEAAIARRERRREPWQH